MKTENRSSIHILEDQSGFIKERYIGKDMRLISDIMENMYKKRNICFLLMLDFERSLDSEFWGIHKYDPKTKLTLEVIL